ncbi:auxin efflux carrier superfamily [Xylariales sp. PMI_506]|nr:auxin efflux carrier superfamily [Xylariales sp. PMI_506]
MDWSSSQPLPFRVNVAIADAVAEIPDFISFKKKPHEAHPDFGHLTLLVFEAVMVIVCISLPGYVIARLGHFDADKQKFLANLNVMLFTPCLIFTKLASQLDAGKLVELAVIPIIFLIQTLVSYLVSLVVAKACRFSERPANFVTAMAVFGNSNSLPISLVVSLSHTLPTLRWDRIPNDTSSEVAARGILYLMIFQQLGQLVRWTWGYNVLLAPRKPEDVKDETRTMEEGHHANLAAHTTNQLASDFGEYDETDDERVSSDDSVTYEPAGRTPLVGTSRASPNESEDEEDDALLVKKSRTPYQRYALDDSTNGPFILPHETSEDDIMSFPRMRDIHEPETSAGFKGYLLRIRLSVMKRAAETRRRTAKAAQRSYRNLPQPIQTTFSTIGQSLQSAYSFLWEFMNPPLWAMLASIFVASIPPLQALFFQDGSFIKNSVTAAVSSSGSVAVPLILVVLGANLARNTQEQFSKDPEEDRIGTRLLIASLISRMVLPTLVMAPLLALFAKYIPVSILDDPIFVIVCFLLSGAPSALQLAQICQLNEVFETVMSRILFQSYAVWLLPSTLVLVMLALETVEWAKPQL